MVVFVVGAPGVGKTTLLEKYLDPFDCYEFEKPKWTISGEYALVGHYGRGLFGGGDTLGYTDGEAAVDFMIDTLFKNPALTHFFLDGDRMSTRTILEKVRAAGVNPYCLHLTASDEELTKRRSERGSNQNAIWAKGRKTKAANFAALFACESRLQQNTSYLTADEAQQILDGFLANSGGV